MAMSPYLTTPFHDRIAPLCETDSWQRWEGYTTVATVTALTRNISPSATRRRCSIPRRCATIGSPAHMPSDSSTG